MTEQERLTRGALLGSLSASVMIAASVWLLVGFDTLLSNFGTPNVVITALIAGPWIWLVIYLIRRI
jgi:hypothetical protein